MNLQDTLRARWRPDFLNYTSLEQSFSNALSFIGAGELKQKELKARGTLSDKGIAEAIREFAGKSIVPELNRTRAKIKAEEDALAQRLADLSRPKIDKTDAAGAMLRSEARTYLRGLDYGNRAGVVLGNADRMILEAVLEAPPELSGLTDDLYSRVVARWLELTSPNVLQGADITREALDLVKAAVQSADMDLQKYVGFTGQAEFRSWLGIAA